MLPRYNVQVSFISQRPCAPVDAYVEAFWQRDARDDQVRILPDGCMDFIFDLSSGAASVVGAMHTAKVVKTEAGQRLFGVRFRAGRAALFLDARAEELADLRVPLAEFRRPLRDLGERIASAASMGARRALIAQVLFASRSRSRVRDLRLERALALIHQTRGRAPVAALAREAGVSERQLERLFRERVGVGAKISCRVSRFEYALELAARTSLAKRPSRPAPATQTRPILRASAGHFRALT